MFVNMLRASMEQMTLEWTSKCCVLYIDMHGDGKISMSLRKD